MGSPAADIGLSERLRPWQLAGLTHIFDPEGRYRSAQASVQPAAHPSPSAQQVSAQPRPPAAGSNANTTQNAAGNAINNPAGSQSPFLEEPWSFYWSKTVQGAKVLITYPELGLDLTGRGDKRRSMLFREILQHVHWMGKGVVTFWPCCTPAGGSFTVNPGAFWKGAQALGVQHVVVFGSPGEEILPPSSTATIPAVINGLKVYSMPAPTDLLSKLPHESHMACDPLLDIRLT